MEKRHMMTQWALDTMRALNYDLDVVDSLINTDFRLTAETHARVARERFKRLQKRVNDTIDILNSEMKKM